MSGEHDEELRDNCKTDGEAQANHERGVADCVSLDLWRDKPHADGPHTHGDGPEEHDHEAAPGAHSHGGWQGSGEPFPNCDHDFGSECRPCIECGDACVPLICDDCQSAR